LPCTLRGCAALAAVASAYPKGGMTMKRLVAFGVAGLLILSTATPSLAFDQENAERIQTLVDTGMQYYWTGGDVKKAEAEIF
jgi:hypothetical protein